jgi:hypothetical protein
MLAHLSSSPTSVSSTFLEVPSSDPKRGGLQADKCLKYFYNDVLEKTYVYHKEVDFVYDQGTGTEIK